jgi:hypothetical protein
MGFLGGFFWVGFFYCQPCLDLHQVVALHLQEFYQLLQQAGVQQALEEGKTQDVTQMMVFPSQGC